MILPSFKIISQMDFKKGIPLLKNKLLNKPNKSLKTRSLNLNRPKELSFNRIDKERKQAEKEKLQMGLENIRA
jgi:hypothetical protein